MLDIVEGIIHPPNHWVSIVLDFDKGEILYRDSLHNVADVEMKQAVNWWIACHSRENWCGKILISCIRMTSIHVDCWHSTHLNIISSPSNFP